MLLNFIFSTGSGLLTAAAIALIKQSLLAKLIPTRETAIIGCVILAIALLFWWLWFKQSPNVTHPVSTFLLVLFGIVLGISS